MDLKLCRLCYKRKANSSIFESGGNEDETYKKILYCCKSVDIQESDGLPANICTICDCELEVCYNFLQKVETSDRKLRSFLSGAPTAQTNLIDYILKTEVKFEEIDNDTHHADSSQLSKDGPEAHQPKKHQLTKEKVVLKKRLGKRVKYKKGNQNCSVCSRTCLSASALSVHMRKHTNEKPFPCSSCDKKYKDSGTLKRHIERNHLQHRERRFICENCGKGFYSKNDITVHMRVHTGETPYTCPICQARFTQLSAMFRHKRRHTDAKTHVCATCGKSFWTREELKKHQSVHNDVRNFECPICNVQFKQKSNIKKHLHVHADPNSHVCSHCGQTFNLKGNLKSHMNRKHSEKSGYCEICCKNMSNIEIHKWRHTGQRPLKCEFCPSDFFDTKALARHINFKHKKTDKFKCTTADCTLAFPSRPMLMYHVAKFHEMQFRYPCDRCPRGFYRKNDLARHKIGTHQEILL